MINVLLLVLCNFDDSQQIPKLSSFSFANIPKLGDLTNLPPSAEEWIPSSALSFKQKEVVAHAMRGSVEVQTSCQ